MIVVAPGADLIKGEAVLLLAFEAALELVKAWIVSMGRVGIRGYGHRPAGFVHKFNHGPLFDGD